MTVQEWLGKDNFLGIDIWEKKYRYNNESFDEWLDRVSGGNQDLKNLIKNKKFLFGGRALSNRKTGSRGSMFNCYSSGYCPDELSGIMELNTNLALTYKSQGGQGLSLTKVRPKGTPIGDRYSSDGIIPFLELFNQTTSVISQGGSRKGALMVSLDIRHKEAEEFIKIKAGDSKISKANLSLEIDDEFMKAVEKFYQTGEEITLHESRTYNGHLVEYDIVPIKLYKMLVENCYDWGDPACLFTNRFRNYNLMEFDDDYEIATSNPCGEQPLPKNFCCNLGSLNLAEFIIHPYTEDAYFDYHNFDYAIKTAVKALDTIIDENKNNHALIEQTYNSISYRNIGLGTMGFGTALMKLGIKYGSEQSKKFADVLFSDLFRQAVYASNNLAIDLGAFPKYKDVLFDSTIMKNHFTANELKILKEYGLRNCSLISIAPTGSIGTMLGVTGGCEPEYAIKYTRKTESLNGGEIKYYDVYCKAVKEYQAVTGNDDCPDYFVSSADINWKDRVDVQACMQNHVDTAISSTVNLPMETPIEDVEQLYLYAWKKGLKGITIFRDGCKRLGILTTSTTPKAEEKAEKKTENKLERGTIIQVNDDVIGKKRKLITGCGSLHVSAFFDPASGDLLETYLSKGSNGGCNNFMIGLSRMISLSARSGCDINTIVDQLNSCGTCPSYAVRTATKHDTSKGSCCPIAIGKALLEMYKEVQNDLGLDESDDDLSSEITSLDIFNTSNNDKKPVEYSKCPECGEKTLVIESGCNSCKSCGYSKCD